MAEHSVSWKFFSDRTAPHTHEVSAIGLVVTYDDRVCRLSIRVSPPLDSRKQDYELALEEFRRLHEALGHNLRAQQP